MSKKLQRYKDYIKYIASTFDFKHLFIELTKHTIPYGHEEELEPILYSIVPNIQNDKKVNYFQTNEIKLEFPNEVPFHVDGEMYHSSKFHILLIPQAINTLYNPYGNHYFQKSEN